MPMPQQQPVNLLHHQPRQSHVSADGAVTRQFLAIPMKHIHVHRGPVHQADTRRSTLRIHRSAEVHRQSLFHRKIGSILGLLAILMSTLAPTISQALAAHDRLGQALATYCSADPANSQAAHDSKSPNSSAFHWQACAYCGRQPI